MHYFKINIGDYARDTQHLTDMEDLAYRRMLDLYYKLEGPLPSDANEIARLIRMRSHSECIAVVLQDFFILTTDGFRNNRADQEMEVIYAKSEKAKKSADARWKKIKELEDANAMRTQCEVDADDMLPITHYPLPITEDLLSCQQDDEPETHSDVEIIIARINELTGQKLKPTTKAHRENITARLSDGHAVDDLLSVVERKSAEWMGTTQQQYLVPATLFRPRNFDRYLMEARLTSGLPTVESLVDAYHEILPEMPPVHDIHPARRRAVTDFCISGKINIDKFKAYLNFIRTECTWVMRQEYGYSFDFIASRETFDKAQNATFKDRK
jgi:uncharacterized phage protein (TIGR02220 family)